MSSSKHKFVNINQKGITPIFEAEGDTVYPNIYYTLDVAVTIDHIVHSQNFEVAWMGLVEKLSDSEYIIYKIYIPSQTVSAASVDIEPDAIAKMAMKVLDDNEDPSKLRYHGHSHVNMAVSPSLVDQEHMFDYLEHADWFIREIRNKKGEQKLDLFDKENGVAFQCLTSEIWEFNRDAAFYEAIDTQLKEFVKQRVPTYYQRDTKTIQPLQSYTKENSLVSEAANRLANLPNKTAEEMELEELLSDPFGVADTWYGRAL
jgi:hypothetical protein